MSTSYEVPGNFPPSFPAPCLALSSGGSKICFTRIIFLREQIHTIKLLGTHAQYLGFQTSRSVSSLVSSWIMSWSELARMQGHPAQGPKKTSCIAKACEISSCFYSVIFNSRNLADLGEHRGSMNTHLSIVFAIAMTVCVIRRKLVFVICGKLLVLHQIAADFVVLFVKTVTQT